MSLDDEVRDKVVVVTGAASGIGRATVERLAGTCAHAVAMDRVATDLPVAHAYIMDVTSEADWSEVTKEILERFGRIDGLVNCAGVIAMGTIADLPLSDFRRVMAVNVEGPFLGMKFVLPVMIAAGRGSIVNISSTAGIAGAPGAGAYCASKGALRMLTKSAALEAIAAGSAVRVNSLHPAMTQTPMVQEIVRQLGGNPAIEGQMRDLQPAGQFISTEAIVDGIIFMLSDRARYMNGTELVIDNGFTAQ